MNIQQSGRELASQSTIHQQQEDQLSIHNLEALQQNPNFFSKLLCLHHIRASFRYFVNGVNCKNIFCYDKDYNKFIPTTRLRDIAMQKHEVGQDFSGFLNLLSTELCPIIVIFVFSLIVSACSIVAIYYQQSLVQTIIIQKTNEQYKYFGIIVGVVCLRFFLYNYLNSLNNSTALNIKVTLQNYYMRIIFMVDNDQFHTNLYKFRYLDIDSIVEGVIFTPIMIINFFIIIGLIVLIFVLDGNYGFIILGIFVLALIILIITLVITYKKLKERQESKTENTKNGKFLFQSLTRMLFENLTDRLIKKMIDIKKKDLDSDRFVNRAYTFIQFVADASVIIPVIILYGLYYNKNSILSLQNTYLTAVYLSMIYFPAKLFVYGSFFVVKAMQNYFSILKDFKNLNKKRVKDLNQNVYTQNHHVYFDNVGECFKYEYQLFHMARFVSKESLREEMKMVEQGLKFKKQTSHTPNFNLLPLQQANNTISLSNYLQCQKQMHHFIQSLTREIPIENTVAIINQNPFLMPQSFKENIILYSQFNEQNKKEFERVLQLVGLKSYLAKAYALQKVKLNGSLSRLYSWHEARLQLARALFHKVDFLIINKYNLIRDTELMRKVIAERQSTNRVTILVNQSNLELLKLTRRVVLFTPNKKIPLVHSLKQILQHKQEEWNQIISKLNKIQLKDRAIKDNIKEQFFDVGQPKPTKLQFKISDYAKYFSLVHPGGILVVILLIVAPPCFKFYDSYLVGQSLKQEIYPTYLIFAVIYFFLIFVRGLFLSGYLRVASKNLFIKITEKYKKLNAVEIIKLYKTSDINIQADFKKIDNDFFMNFELGFTSLLEGIVGLVILACGLPIYLAMAMPVTVITMIVNFMFTSVSKDLQTLKRKHVKVIRNYVNVCTNNSFQLFRYKKFDAVQKRFHQLNKISVLFAANQMWILSGMRMIGEIIILIGLVVFLIIMINTQKNQVANLSMVGLGVSLFLNLNSSFRFSIKTFSLIGTQLTSVSRIWSMIDEKEQNQDNEQGCQIKLKLSTQKNQFQTISFEDVVFTVGDIKSKKINFTLNRGDRVVVSCDSYVMARIIFLALNPKIPDPSCIDGRILVNYSQSINDKQLIVMYLHDCPLLPIQGTVFEGCKFIQKELKQDSFDSILEKFFKDIGVKPLFSGESPIAELPMAYRQILNLFKVCCLQRCDILVIMNGLDDIPILSRQRMETYLIKSDIPIVISITNLSSIISLYPRHFSVENKELKQIKDSLQIRKPIIEAENNMKL